MMKLGVFALLLIAAGSFASCSQQLGPPVAASSAAEDFFWPPVQLTHGINYYVLRNGVGRYHLLSSIDGSHIEDGALNEVTMVAHANPDSVILDSMGVNSIFSLPTGYYFGSDSVSYILVHDSVKVDSTVWDTTVFDTLVQDTLQHDTTYDTSSMYYWRTFDTSVRDSSAGRLLLLLRTALDSGASWHAGTLYGLAFPNGIAVTATVLDQVDSLYIPPVVAGADSAFGESFRIRYAPQNSDSATSPIYWIAYYSRNAGPVLIQQYSFDSVSQRAQIVGQKP
ncbi:MAG TPA: hypothetical protein VFH95_03215 [Candidatus Kapabacteria bacterium]|nr:hypothetical protein [Candidatus Kapabacteria bacterium]